MRHLRQSTSVDLPIGPFLDATDGITAETGLTLTQPDIRLKKNAGAWAQKAAAQTLSHEENGWYEVTLDATDTGTLGLLQLAVVESGAAPVWHEFMVLTADAWDALYAGSGNGVRANVQAIAAGAITAAAIATGAVDADALATDAVAEIADGVWDEALSGHTTAGTAGQRIQPLDTGTAQAGAAGTLTLRAGASAVDDAYLDQLVQITGGTGAGQGARVITDYVGATKVATVTPNWTTTPDNTSVYMVLPGGASTGGSGLDAAGVRSAIGLASANLDTQLSTIDTVVDAILVDTGTTLDARIPAALVSGRMDASVGAMAANTMTAAAAAADLGTELGTAVWATTTRTLSDGAGVKKNTALAAFPFKMVDATDGFTAETGVSITATRSLDGAAFGACANAAVEVSGGWYTINLAAGDVNGNTVVLRFAGTGCRTTEIVIVTEP